MRNKPFPYRLSGWLLLAGLAMALPSSAEEIQGECFHGNPGACIGTTKSVEVTFKATFITPSCDVVVPSEITLPDATLADFDLAAKGHLSWLDPLDFGGAEEIYANFDATISHCDPVIDKSGFKYLRLKFTDLGNTSSEAGVFATDYPSRDDVGFVIFSTNNSHNNVLAPLVDLYFPDEISGADSIYHFRVRMQKYTNYTGAIGRGSVSGSVAVIAEYE